MMIEKHFEGIILKKFGFDFSPTQSAAVELFTKFFFERKKDSLFLLRGYAGKNIFGCSHCECFGCIGV